MDVEMLIDKYQLNDSEAEVLRFMKKNRQSLKTIGIRDVAKATYVSTATIINMAKKIGYSGYSELVFALGNSQSDIAMPSTFSNEEKAAFIDLLSEYLYGFRATANSHLEFLRQQVQQDILLVIISNSGDTVRLAELAKMANDHHIDVIAFVGQKNSKIGSLATLTISTETYTPQRISDYQPNLFFGTTLNQFELLLSAALKAIFE